MSVVAFIPARGGSKGVPKKNIKLLAGKPLIAWSIEQAKKSKNIDRVIVSTDCPEIAKVALEFGAEVPFMRPVDISSDIATTESAMLHCCDYLNDKNELPEIFVLIQCTSPLRAEGTFDKAIERFKLKGYDSMLSVSLSHRFTWKDKDNPSASYDFMNRPRRQDIKEKDQEYLETGSFYITNTKKLLASKNRLTGKIGMFETPEIESFEIDSHIDFTICEELVKHNNLS
ncbi:CMP-N-acetylneuraminic acid synthetase [Pseudoalteromonas sp. 13-15]|uniref:acylneuraminate cytidylyltransferase family protein n=1 Tax=Pseudoalteromonas TaxID=53246 RepID=UPI00072FEF84|nr:MULTISPECIES: acylneuraminate cytidylyltransferase family protein [Pseudoalteromonas]AUL74555.1 CMP-N-acetylneuraminic acid synthetase [Pseudoalteromonas sp. 13-15]SIO05402.1 N-acylneuraminate cytidylyltransferase [Pseudoalteromonas marina]